MSSKRANLWRHQDFLKLWCAQTTSVFGSQMASLAYPLTAISVLQATTFQVGLLSATGTAAGALVGLFAGVIFSALGFGFLFGALAVKSITKRFGVRRTMIGANFVNISAIALIPLASGSMILLVALFAVSHFLHAFGVQINGINLMSLRQAVTPNHLQGRMNASFRFVNVGMMMFGALIAGFLGESLGLRTTLAVGACGMIFPFLRLLFSPVRNLAERQGEKVG